MLMHWMHSNLAPPQGAKVRCDQFSVPIAIFRSSIQILAPMLQSA